MIDLPRPGQSEQPCSDLAGSVGSGSPGRQPPFVIMALPRSRTAWLARFLSYRDWSCGHDEIRHARGMDDLASWLSQPNTGTVETGAAPFWRTLRKLRPDARVVIVRRPVEDVVASVLRTGPAFDQVALCAAMRRLDHKLDQVERRWPGALVVPFRDLADEATCARIFEHCLPHRHDPTWWRTWSTINIQIDMAAVVRFMAAHRVQLEKITAQVKCLTVRDLTSRPVAVPDDLTIQQERFDDWFRDGQRLFAEHACVVGEHPNAPLTKNLALMRRLDEIGALQITTARSNGRMLGYLMVIVGPSLEAPDVMTATNSTFFASADARGLGSKLQRASLDALREQGIGEVFMRSGTRGSGPKMGALYRRLGAEEYGHLFKLEMAGA